MLVLTRRPGRGDQAVIQIGDRITIEVIDTKDGNVRLGITAPLSMRISGRQDDMARGDKRR